MMNSIIVAIMRVNDLMGEIANASDKQSHGITQVGQAVAQMDGVTQQNTSLVEQSTGAGCIALEDQASPLTDAVALFKLYAQDKYLSPAVALLASSKKSASANDNWELLLSNLLSYNVRRTRLTLFLFYDPLSLSA
ncbi:MAG: hypothetical protein ACR5LD_05515 [Symbiopectobacterium sp.]